MIKNHGPGAKKSTQPQRLGTQGFTLIEMMIVVGLMAVGSLELATLSVLAVKQKKKSESQLFWDSLLRSISLAYRDPVSCTGMFKGMTIPRAGGSGSALTAGLPLQCLGKIYDTGTCSANSNSPLIKKAAVTQNAYIQSIGIQPLDQTPGVAVVLNGQSVWLYQMYLDIKAKKILSPTDLSTAPQSQPDLISGNASTDPTTLKLTANAIALSVYLDANSQVVSCNTKQAQLTTAAGSTWPKSMVIGFHQDQCPSGWNKASAYQGRMLLGYDSSDPSQSKRWGAPGNNNFVNGGEEAHQLNVSEMPAHLHVVGIVEPDGRQMYYSGPDSGRGNTYDTLTGVTGSAGGFRNETDLNNPKQEAQPYSVLPPYYVVSWCVQN